MKREVHDNIIQEKITGLQEIPDYISFTPGKSWDQLEKQLQPKQKKKTIMYLAAAVLITTLLISSVKYYTVSSTYNNKEVVLQKSFFKNVNPKNAYLESLALKKREIKPSIIIKKKRNVLVENIVSSENKKMNDSILAFEKSQKENSIIINSLVETTPNILEEPIVIKNITEKKKFRIIHLNELNIPQPPILTLNKNISLEEIIYKTGNSNSDIEIKSNKPIFQLQRNKSNTSVGINENQ
jgi:hypothetical protein